MVEAENLLYHLPVIFFVGISMAFACYALVIFGNNRQRDFLWYGLYLISICFYFSTKSSQLSYALYRGNIQVLYFINEVTQTLNYIFYILFALAYLNIGRNYPSIYRYFRAVCILLIVFVVVDGIGVLNGIPMSIQSQVMNYQRLVMIAFAVSGYILMLRQIKNNLVYFIVIGSFVYTVGAVLTWITVNIQFFVAGAFLENFLFAVGLGYKIKQLNQRKAMAEQEAFRHKVSMLRAQMNPHFIFNSLNSIQALIIDGNKRNAVNYLSMFARLLRQTLDTSEEGTIPLSKEIGLLETYLKLESLRFEDKLAYEITTSPSLDVDDLEIPILLIQPFVENAIIHGLTPKKNGERQVKVTFQDESPWLVCQIIDNGIGRSAASALKKQRGQQWDSKGMSVAEQRIALVNNSQHIVDAQIDIEDLKSPDGTPAGTAVTIKIAQSYIGERF